MQNIFVVSVLSSAPLVRTSSGVIRPLNDPVVFDQESTDIKNMPQKYYLAFENEYGELEACHSDRIRKLLLCQKGQSSIQIVFVNACHSEEVGRVFLEAGVTCVIAVESDLKIEDNVARNFSKIFYQEIFNMKTISEAFKNAMSLTQGIEDKNIYTCCCAHNHHPNCEWEGRALEEGFSKLHSQHIPRCTCRRAYMHIHK